MKIYHGFSDKRLIAKPRSIAIGIFDGVHLGHQKILKQALKIARRDRILATVVTFDPHPQRVLFPKKNGPSVLMSLEHRLRILQKIGIDEALVTSFNKKFSKVTHENFLKKFLLRRLGAKFLSMGHDFRFGYRALGNCDYLKRESKSQGFVLSLVRPVTQKGRIVSSTALRELIEAGDLERARRMLGRPVSVFGTVIRGKGRGKKIGFPTANLNPHHETLPPPGVYAALGDLNGRRLKGVIHIGHRPTFGEKEKTLEVHFIDFKENIYGKDVELIFIAKLRGTQKFHNQSALVKAIRKDSSRALKLITQRAA